MNKEDLIRLYHTKRVSPFDGMAVTAEVWEQAHDYHRQQRQMHMLFNHGSGIVSGLEVIASDPPDSTVYILPGLAIDPLGQVIMVTEPTAYDVEEADGLFCLMLSHGESLPRPDDDRDAEGSPLYTYPEFGIELGRPGFTDVAAVELAVIRRQDRRSSIVDAQDAEHPGLNEIDMRFRQAVGVASQKQASLAVTYVGEAKTPSHGSGASYLARALRRSGDLRVWVDRDVLLTPDLEGYTLVYLVGVGVFELSPEEMQILYDYVQGGGTLLIESCRGGDTDGTPPADTSFSDLLGSLGFGLSTLEPGHDLLLEPFLFATPPPGVGPPSVQVGDGVIFSASDYGCLWHGERPDVTPSREEIRSAMEWGANIVAYAIARRERMQGE